MLMLLLWGLYLEGGFWVWGGGVKLERCERGRDMAGNRR